MAELLKHRFNSTLIFKLGDALQLAYKPFGKESFMTCVLKRNGMEKS